MNMGVDGGEFDVEYFIFFFYLFLFVSILISLQNTV